MTATITSACDDDMVALVARAQAGDTAAFGSIYDAHIDRIYHYVAARVHHRPLAEDITADTFLRALRHIGSFGWQGRPFIAWLYTLAAHVISDHHRSARVRYEVQASTFDEVDRIELPTGECHSPEHVAVTADTNRIVRDAVARLRPSQRQCIELRFFAGFSVAETALAMGIADGAVKSMTHRAVKALASLLPEGIHQ